MRMMQWSKDDIRPMLQLLGFFIAFGVLYGWLRDDLVSGIMAGVILFGIVMGVGFLMEWISRGRR